jgi:hypothetical protein
MSDDDLRYPIGRFEWSGMATGEQHRAWLDEMERAPADLRAAVNGLSGSQLDTAYRPGGWTVRQVVHHVADSHMNSYVRFRLALTEDEPTIKPYFEERWANLPDARAAEIEVSLGLLETLHRRWLLLLRALGPADWQRTFRHPEHGVGTLERSLALYAWHGRHHICHIRGLRDRMGW